MLWGITNQRLNIVFYVISTCLFDSKIYSVNDFFDLCLLFYVLCQFTILERADKTKPIHGDYVKLLIVGTHYVLNETNDTRELCPVADCGISATIKGNILLCDYFWF